jgi:hypothetical protein
MKILADNFRTHATAEQPFVLTADSFSGPRPANSRPAATFRQTAEPRRQTVEPFYQAAGPCRQTAGLPGHLAERCGQTVELLDGLAESICQTAVPAKSASFQRFPAVFGGIGI